MRIATIIGALLALAVTAPARADKPNTYGKSDAQIIAMGPDYWVNFYTSKAGDTTATTVDALRIYGAVLQRRNVPLLRRLPAGKRQELLSVRSALRTFANEATEASACRSGGGSQWSVTHAAVAWQVEELIGALLGLKVAPAPARTTGQVRRQLTAFQRRGEQDKAAMASYPKPFTYTNFEKHIATAGKTFTGIATSAAKLPRAQSDRLLDFCFSYVSGD